MMGLYHRHILPKAIHWACNQKSSRKQRQKVVPFAIGKVLEIGIGSGLNLPFYDASKVKHLTALDPSVEVWKKNEFNTNNLGFGFQFINAFAEDIPLASGTFDTVVMTYTLCSINDTVKALAEIRRLLKPRGVLLFCEHGKAPEKAMRLWQNIINPFWKHISGGCQLNRNIPEIIEGNGFKISSLESNYISGKGIASFNYWGKAQPV